MTSSSEVVRDAAVAVLPRVTADRPAAVLLVDVGTQQVLFANALAEQLAPGLRLPAPVEDWASRAELRDLRGRPLQDDHPLGEVAEGRAVPGRGVSARRASDVSSEREPLWAVSVPLHGAPMLDHCALVVLLPLGDVDPEDPDARALELGEQAGQGVRDRAVLATGLAFTVVDAQAPDMPLVWVNPAFTAATGYAFEEAVGRNCRFLQGPETDPATVRAIGEALRTGTDVTVTLLNYRKDGTAFWNQLAVSPVLDGDGELTHFVGIQLDVTEKRASELAREQALVAERHARAESERVRAGLSLLVRATGELSSSLDPHTLLSRLARLVVPLLAEWVVINRVDASGMLEEVVVEHVDGLTELTTRFSELADAGLTAASPVRQVLASGQPQLLTRIREDDLDAYVGHEELREVINALGVRSSMVVPLTARRGTLGTMALVSTRRDFDEEDLVLAAELGRRAGLMVDNARLYQREHEAALLLQQSLLPVLPELDGLEVEAGYFAGDTAAEVGGDFYELLALPDGAVGLAVGDVVGHDLAAAAAMGHLRGLLRACGYDTAADTPDADADPATVLARVDRLVQGLQVAPLATLLYGVLRRTAPGWELRTSSAGHPPLVARDPDGRARLLDVAPDVLLGVLPGAERGSTTCALADGTLLVAYTDGLVERRGEDLDVGLERLRARIEALPVGASPAEVVARLTPERGGQQDDVAMLVVRLGAPG